ncbi:MAG TPA: putative Ig domain-containing protein, partial [Rhodopila sp.]|nr:putative Ig domain-containing protein [Rhodopila sp.]
DTFTATVLGAPVVAQATPNQVWTEGKAVNFTLPSGTFTDPENETLTYTATQSNGQALPNWLVFSAATGTFTGTAPTTAQSLGITVTATDSSKLATSETFTASVQPAASANKPGITVATQTPAQTWTDGKAVNLVLPSTTFTDALGLRMTFAAYQVSGPNVTSWLRFNAASDDFFGTVPTTAGGTVALEVVATDSQHMTATDLFEVTFASAAGHTGLSVLPVSSGALSSITPTHTTSLWALPT